MEKIKITYYQGVPGICTTDCPHGMAHFAIILSVGSDTCQKCQHFGGLEGQYVICNFKNEEGKK